MIKLAPSQRTFTRILNDRFGEKVTVRVVLDEGEALDRVIARLANKVRSSKTQRAASAADGVIRVTIEEDSSVLTCTCDVDACVPDPACPRHGD
jgi:hypothetical protein